MEKNVPKIVNLDDSVTINSNVTNNKLPINGNFLYILDIISSTVQNSSLYQIKIEHIYLITLISLNTI